MSEPEFPAAAGRVVATVAKLLSLQGQADLAEVVTGADARIEAVGSDFGVMYYTLSLQVPINVFARIEPTLSDIETAIQSKLQTVARFSNDVISGVTVSPVLEEPMASVRSAELPEDQAQRLWEPNRYRVFLSHVALHKVQVSGLKRSLGVLGLSAFVAHEDIEPTLLWQGEIDLALRSMDVMVALLTPEFHESKWTDQEIGAAIARGIIVVPVRLGLDPYGFLGKHQALPGDLAKPDELAAAIVSILERRASGGERAREGLILGLESANTYANAKLVTAAIERATGFSSGQLQRMEAAIGGNAQVKDAIRVPERLRSYIGTHSASTAR